jgi:hypothetical protein
MITKSKANSHPLTTEARRREACDTTPFVNLSPVTDSANPMSGKMQSSQSRRARGATDLQLRCWQASSRFDCASILASNSSKLRLKRCVLGRALYRNTTHSDSFLTVHAHPDCHRSRHFHLRMFRKPNARSSRRFSCFLCKIIFFVFCGLVFHGFSSAMIHLPLAKNHLQLALRS